MNGILHKMYVATGVILCRVFLVWWRIRDYMFPPKSNAVLFVAHPDDDTLFFHTFIKEHKPYVCLMTTGWSLRRMPCFFKAMKYYGVRFRAYPLKTNDLRIDLHRKIVQAVLNIGEFHIVATHNATGEYGHEEHKRVYSSVKSVLRQSNRNVAMLCPEQKEAIEKYPLPKDVIAEKEGIFKTIYITESWVIEEDSVWIENEHLVNIY